MNRGIFALVSEERLRDVLETLHAYTELPLQLAGSDGEILLQFGKETGYCKLLHRHVFTGNECAQLHAKAGQRARQLGDSYIFTCHSNMNHIAFPLVHQGEMLGCIIIGPFLMDAPDSTLVSSLLEQHPLSPLLALELYDELSGIQVVPPHRVNHLSRLVGHLLSPLLPAERALLMLSNERLNQQSRINETIQMYKEQGVAPSQSYFYQKENALLAKVKTGSIKEVKAMLNDLLGYVLFSEGGRIESMRAHAIELTTLLSRIAIEGGAQPEEIFNLSSRFILRMNESQSIDVLCQLLQDMAESFMGAMFSRTDKGNPHIRHALLYISEHFAEPLTLAGVAAQVKLSPNYFSALFRQMAGMSFREHLMRVRVEESKHLLLSSSHSLTDIAMAVGFADQSYYCKVFKRIVGMTPGKFRA
ncbi:MAG: PocR ligand-binding domain-containing protein [Clostridia bacterium]|nr:PocR ligand-binding domain-containing protein [Clostridia bacterium]